MKNFLLSILLGISAFVSLSAADIITLKKGDINLVGHVLCNGEHVPFVTIVVKGTNVGTSTDETGHFMLPNLPQGEFTVIAQAIGYQKQEKLIKLTTDKMYEVNFELREDLIGLEEVVVSADRNEMNRKEAPVIITPITAKLLTRSAAPVLAEGLSFSPGIRLERNCGNCGFTQVRLNGLNGPYTQILINSRPVFSAVAGVYGLEQIPANMIQRVEVVRGGGSALFGGSAIAGTVNIITKDPVSNSFSLGAQYNAVGVGVSDSDEIGSDMTVGFNGSVVSSSGNDGVFIFGMKRERDPWDANDDGYSELTKLRNTSVGFRAFHRFSPKSKLDYEYFTLSEDRRGGDKFDYVPHEANIAEWLNHNINSGSLAWDYFLNRETNTKLSVYSSAQHLYRQAYYGAEMNPAAYGNTKDLALASGIQLSGETQKLFFGASRYVLGVENNYATLKDYKLGYLDTLGVHQPNSTVADQKAVTYGVYAQNQWSFSKAKLVLGLRVDNYSITNNEHNGSEESKTVVIPRASFMYDINDHIQTRISYGKGYRAPQIFSEDLHIESSGARRIEHKVDKNLKQEVSNSFTGSVDFNGSIGNGQFSLLLEGFYTKLDNPFANEIKEDENTPGLFISRRYNEVSALVQGLNTELKYSPSAKLQVQLGMTFQSSKYDDGVAWGTDDAETTKEFTRTPNTYGFATINWNIIHNWEFSVNGTYTGKMKVPHLGMWKEEKKMVNGKEVTERSPDTENSFVKAGQVIAGDELVETDPFFDLGLKLSYHRHISKKNEIELFAGVRNLFNSYQTDFDKGVKRDAAYVYGPLNPRTIYFGVKIGNLGK